MGRNQKEAFDFFPLYTDFFENDKIKKLRRTHGAVGVITYINILCRIYGGNGYYFKISSMDDLVSDITEQIVGQNERPQHVASKVRGAIRYLLEQDILDGGFLEQSVITGRAMQEQYADMAAKAKRLAKIGIYSLIDACLVVPENSISSEEMPISSEEIAVNSEETMQSKVKESKNKQQTPIQRERAREEEIPMFVQIAKFIRENSEFGSNRVVYEADRFILYNEKRGWDCLPDWQSACLAWISKAFE